MSVKNLTITALIALYTATFVQHQIKKENQTQKVINNYSYKNMYNEETVQRIDEFKKFLIEKRPLDSLYIEDLFNQPTTRIDENIIKLLNPDKKENTKKDKRTSKEKYQAHLKFINMESLKIKYVNFLEEKETQLLDIYKKTKVDPRVIAGHLAVETFFGNLPEYYKNIKVWYPSFNALLTNYVCDKNMDSEKIEKNARFAKQQGPHYIELIKNRLKLKPAEANEIKSSYKVAIGYEQFLPYSYTTIFSPEEEIKPYDMDFAIIAVARYLEHKRFGRWKPHLNGKKWKHYKSGNRMASMRYNYSPYYNKDIWETLTPLTPYRSIAKMELDIDSKKTKYMYAKENSNIQKQKEMNMTTE
ncbi:lytic murein transglycosylase [Candidatus Woesearchaeota archaeon]|nr:lytic murein transglycosylase [Candidatus Woesearchaeota archaeon]MCF7901383.1 lytic murein transglycosylase [Candidatus Woesearchaeota archaeon]MCF8013146.1 lytic murein transglycosylase [Candidatus Woesearchaeota archaeon]